MDVIRPLVSLSDNGNLVSNGPEYVFRLKHVLVSAIEFDEEIPACEIDNLITDSVRDALSRNSLTQKGLKDAIWRAEREFLRKKVAPYILATSISLREMPPFRKVSVEDHEIRFSKRLPSSFECSEAVERIERILGRQLPDDYVSVRVSSKDRTPTAAAEKARDALALLMGIWNFTLTGGTFSISLTGGEKGPIADLRLGPMSTLHNPDGTLATQTIWYEPTYSRPAVHKDYTKDFGRLRGMDRFVLSQLGKRPYQQSIRKAFIRYAMAVDEPRLSTAFLELWGVLEQLTHTGRDPYTTTIRRAAYIYANPRRAREELVHLKDLRNNMVHLGQSSSDPQSHVYQLKKYVDDMFAYVLSKKNSALTQEELDEMLDLPSEVDELKQRLEECKRKQRLYSRALRSREK